MKRDTGATPRNVFMHLLSTVMLYVGTISLIAILFQYINLLFPDKLTFYRRSVLDIIRISSSSLIVVFPVYLLVNYVQFREYIKHPESRERAIRKWLIYLTLFIAALTIIVDLIQVTNGFYSGELTVQFVLKACVVLLMAFIVFAYYLWDLRRKRAASPLLKKFFAVSIVCVLSILVSGFFIAGSPNYQRMVRFDDERVNHLQQIQSQVVNQFSQKRALPATLKDLNDNISGFTAPLDPSTSAPYEYRITGQNSFELCATFQTESDNRTTAFMGSPKEFGFIGDSNNWKHTDKRTCFSRTIDPEMYKPTTR